MKRHIALLLAFCMLLTSFPVRSVQAAGEKKVPQGIILDISSGSLKIGFGREDLTTEENDWLQGIEHIRLNGVDYMLPGGGHENYQIKIDGDDSCAYIDNHCLILNQNSVEIRSRGHEPYIVTFQRADIQNMASGLTIQSIKKSIAGEGEHTSHAVGATLDYKHKTRGAALDYICNHNIESVNIDGIKIPYAGSDGRKNFIWFNGVLNTYDKMPDAKKAIANFEKNDKHQFIITMKDGSSVEKTDEGYVSKSQEPKVQKELEKVNTGGMSAIWEIVKFTQPITNRNNAILFTSDTPQSEWHDKFLGNIRYILVDDNGGEALRPGFSNFFIDAKKKSGDIGLQGQNLEFAMDNLNLLNGEAHKVEIGFKDGTTLTYTQAGYVTPQEIKFDVKKYIAEQDKKQEPQPGNENKLNKQYPIQDIDFKKGYGDPELCIKVAREALSKVKAFKLNGKRFTNKTVLTESYKGLICSDSSTIEHLFGQTKLEVVLEFEDGSESKMEKAITPVANPKGSDPSIQPEVPKIQTLTDAATGVKVEYPNGALEEGTELKVKSLDKAAFLNTYGGAKSSIDKIKEFSAYEVSLEKGGEKKAVKGEVKLFFPIKNHERKTLKFYHAYLEKDDEGEGMISGADPLTLNVQDSYAVINTNTFGCYFLTSGKEAEIEKPKDPRKEAVRFQIQSVSFVPNLSGVGEVLKIKFKNFKEEDKEAFAEAIKNAGFSVNGDSGIKGVEGAFNYNKEFEVWDFQGNGSQLIEALKKAGTDPHVKVTFSDGSTWENRAASEKPKKTDDFDLTDDLPNGEYTLNFEVTRENTNDSSKMVESVIGKRAKLTVNGKDKKVSFRASGKLASILLDLVLGKGDQFKPSIKTTEGLNAGEKIFTCSVKDLSTIYKMGVLVTAMKGTEDQIGQYGKYMKADVHFKQPIKKGWKGFDDLKDPKKVKEKNDKDLTLKLIEAKVDKNGDGIISKDELRNATGELDLSGEKYAATPDISMLKDLGPGVSSIILDSNNITQLPEGIFDNMTGLTKISLGGNKLSELSAGVFKNNKNLAILWLEGNQLSSLPEDLLKNNPLLSEVALSRNGLKELPKGFLTHATKLEALWLAENDLTSLEGVLPKEGGRFKSIVASENHLRTLPKELANYKQLSTIKVAHNHLTSIPEGLSKLRTLVELDLSFNRIESLPESMWTRMASNASLNSTKYPKFLMTGNLLREIPFEKMAAKAQGSRVTFNKFDVSLNYLKPSLDANDMAIIQKAGVKMKSNDNQYQPQMTAMNPRLSKTDKGLKLEQDLDFLQMAYWINQDINDWDFFKSPQDYLAFVKDVIYKKHSIQTHNDHLAFAQILDKNHDWKIQTVVERLDESEIEKVFDEWTKNEGHNQRVSEIDPVDANDIEIPITSIANGGKYRVTRNYYEKHANVDFSKKLSYSVEIDLPKPDINKESEKAKNELRAAIAAAEAKLKDGKDYTDETKQAVKDQLKAANGALNGKDAEAMNKAKAALENAVKALKEKPKASQEDEKLKEAKDALTKAIQEAKNKLKDGKTYTAETKAAVEKAITQAEKDVAGRDIGAINKAKADLEKAVAGLKEAQKPTPQPKPSDDKKDKPNSGSSGWIGHRPGGNSQSTPAKPQESKPVEKPKTTETKPNFTVNVPKEAFVKGYPDGSFKPNQKVVRSELATMLARFVSVSGDLQKALADIRPTDWYFDSFKTLINAGIITGYGDGNYRPNGGVTRAQAVTMIAKLKGLQPKQGAFKDVPANAWYAGYAGALKEAGIVVGYEDGSFGGDRVVTRAEIIAMINRAFNIPKKESRKAFSDLPENHWAYEDIQKAAN
ncbi:S-layer homology domain-containing protein [Aedoeadaptatus pacaensis]|uniref:S-layer homology domain-containing protein n=1 Tax=Aedoeadaptatus pacaensis TaxID=1776390 RepID=UPI000839454F|nr:S-layer homology domain-containing protein [Peptoniphilus pacaensis]